MTRVKSSEICLCVAVVVFSVISKTIFDKVHLTSQVIIDEEFHLTIGKAYCRYEFDKWHPKITTFPGLYLLSSLLLGAFDLCSIYWLRFVSLFCSFFNIFLFYCISSAHSEKSSWKDVTSALNLALLPPLYFFSHLYYTDVASLTMILLLFLSSQRGNHYLASLFGMLSVLFRQTNIIWVGMAFGIYVVKELSAINQNKKESQLLKVSGKEIVELLGGRLLTTLKRTSLNFWLNSAAYGSLLLVFVLFVRLNGSIVVGDRTAHEVTINLPQIFYFALFALLFGWPHFVPEIPSFLRFVKAHKVCAAFVLVLSLVIVHYNTIVHPYVLADNRHYVFYIWNRFYGRYVLFRYAIVPVYLFSLFVIVSKGWRRQDVTFMMFFVPCTLAVLVPQKLLEFRYFFVPYVLFRLQIRNVSAFTLLCEFLTCCVLNAITLHLFFNKSIQWADYDYPQRLIW